MRFTFKQVTEIAISFFSYSLHSAFAFPENIENIFESIEKCGNCNLKLLEFIRHT